MKNWQMQGSSDFLLGSDPVAVMISLSDRRTGVYAYPAVHYNNEAMSWIKRYRMQVTCLLYTSDAADDCSIV